MGTSQVVFLLGAGASIKAGVPDTFKFVEQFRSYVININDKKTIEKIVDVLETWKSNQIDIELLLETLMKLADKDKEPLLRFFIKGEFILDGYPEKQPLIEQLKDYIKEKATVTNSEKVDYLQPLRGFIEDFGQLDMVSVNYDTCIEHFCSINRLAYTDGFTDRWYPEVFENTKNDVRLYKLHGSVLWYKGDDYIKSPIMTSGSEVHLFTGESAKSLMLYPVQKLDYSGPILELLMRVKSLLQDKECKFLVVVGYSFRDEQIRALLIDVARKNKDLTLVLIDPKALIIYQNMLRYLDENSTIPSPLKGRVVCLPYKFEEVLPFLKNQYILHLSMSLNTINNLSKEEIRGNQVNWLACLENLAEAEYLEKLQYILDNKVEQDKIEADRKLYIQIMVRFIANNMAGENIEESTKWVAKLRNYLMKQCQTGASVNILSGTLPGSLQVYISNKVEKGILDEQKRYIDLISNMTLRNIAFEDLGFIKKVIAYLDNNKRMSFEDYLESRRPYITDITDVNQIIAIATQLKEDIMQAQARACSDGYQELSSILTRIESKYVGSLF